MKLAEPGLELVIRGSSSACVPTFGKWESTVLTKAYENVDSVFCHAYCYERGVASQQEADLKVHQSLGAKPWPKAPHSWLIAHGFHNSSGPTAPGSGYPLD